MSCPDFALVGGSAWRILRTHWDKDLAHRTGVTFATIARFRKLGWLSDDYDLQVDAPPYPQK